MSAAHQIEARARQLFREVYGYPPAAVAVAPGRMNIIGEHTDYNGGWVLPAAIDRFIGVAFRERRDTQVMLRSERYPPIDFSKLPDSKQGTWPDYIVGVARELEGRPGLRQGFDLLVTSDLPTGSGLSSSAALEVAFAVAYLEAGGRSMPPADLAALCQRAENVFVGARTGIMDQFTALSARAGNAILLDCRTLQAEDIPMPDGRHAFLLVDSKVRRDLAASAYNERRSECERAAAALGVKSLRDAAETDLERLEDPLLRRRARHVITENRRVLAAAAALRRRDAEALAPLLAASHESLRDDFQVSCPELDLLVTLALESPRVVGARMMGGGFGGSVIVLVEAAAIEDLEQHLQIGYADAVHKSPEFHRVRSVDGTMPARSH
ncbi:MAG: galactokinase [Candidatus Dormibacteraeota bacterium]|nr:galactokinase [Candidatus Dormibacteraeota bacterium]